MLHKQILRRSSWKQVKMLLVVYKVYLMFFLALQKVGYLLSMLHL